VSWRAGSDGPRIGYDLAAAFAAHPPAAQHFAAFPRSAKRSILEWIVQARRPESRAKRIAEAAEKAAVDERANQPRPLA